MDISCASIDPSSDKRPNCGLQTDAQKYFISWVIESLSETNKKTETQNRAAGL